MLLDHDRVSVKELVEAMEEYAFNYPSLDPDEYTEWDTQEWFDEEIEAYADVVGEVVERIHRGEMREADLYRTEARQRGIEAGNFDGELVVVADDESRSYGPRRKSAVGDG